MIDIITTGTSGGNGLSMDDLSTNIEVENIEIKNVSYVGIFAKTDPSCAFLEQLKTFSMNNILIHDCYLHKIGHEGMYLGSSKYKDGYSVTCNNRDYKVISSEIGIYNFYSDSTYSKKIFVLPIVSNTFPLNNSPCEMLESMRVFYTKTSIDSLKNTSIGCKIELDKLWLQLCNFDEIRAKESIREYYTRVTLANKKYTSINYGMYTDRGICLILFGEPLTIKQSSDEEIWYYTKDADSDDKIFIFEKGKNMFTDYTLQSKKSKEIFFEQAKSNWYQGKPFNLKN